MGEMIRDFSKESINNLREIAKNTNEDWNLFDWFSDTFLTEELDIRDNINNLNNYHEVMMDKYNIGEYQLNQIIKNVNEIDNSYKTVFDSLNDVMEGYLLKITKLTDTIVPTHMAVDSATLNKYLSKLDNNYQSGKLKSVFGTDNIEEIKKIIENNGEASSLELQTMIAMAKLYPDTLISSKLLDIMTNSLSKNFKVSEDVLNLITRGMQQAGNNFLKLADVIDDIIKPAITMGPEGAKSFMMYGNDIVGDAFVVSTKLKTTGTSLVKSSKFLGVTFGVASVVLGTWDDVNNGNKTIGEGLSHNILGLGAGALGAVTTIAIAGGPIGWTALGIGFVGSIVGTALYEGLYENNIFYAKDIVDGIGSGLDWCGDRISDIGEGIGDVVSWVNPFD